MYGREWDSDEVELLRRHRKSGTPLQVTAKQLGRSYSAVKSFASDHGILKEAEGPWTKSDDACLLVMGRNGLSASEIGALMGRSMLAVRQRLIRLKLSLAQLRALGPVAPP